MCEDDTKNIDDLGSFLSSTMEDVSYFNSESRDVISSLKLRCAQISSIEGVSKLSVDVLKFLDNIIDAASGWRTSVKTKFKIPSDNGDDLNGEPAEVTALANGEVQTENDEDSDDQRLENGENSQTEAEDSPDSQQVDSQTEVETNPEDKAIESEANPETEPIASQIENLGIAETGEETNSDNVVGSDLVVIRENLANLFNANSSSASTEIDFQTNEKIDDSNKKVYDWIIDQNGNQNIEIEAEAAEVCQFFQNLEESDESDVTTILTPDDETTDVISIKSGSSNRTIILEVQVDVSEVGDSSTIQPTTAEIKKQLEIRLIDYKLHNHTYSSSSSLNSSSSSTIDGVDRLCDLSSLGKRNHTHNGVASKSKAPKSNKTRKKPVKSSSSEHESYSDFSDDTNINTENSHTNLQDTGLQITSVRSVEEVISDKISDKINELLAKDICKKFMESADSDIDTDSSTDTLSSNKSEDKSEDVSENINPGPSTSGTQSTKKILTAEEKARRSWRSDPLLRGSLSDSSSSDEGSANMNRSKIRKRLVISSSDTEKSEKEEKRKRTRFNEKYDDSKGNSTDHSKSTVLQEISDSDKTSSDLELLETKPFCDSEFIQIDDDSDAKPEQAGPSKANESPNAKGRKNIRALMTETDLTESTQHAKTLEEQRKKRIADILKNRTDLETDSSDFVLDYGSTPQIRVHPHLTKRLQPHQREGVLFMWLTCYESYDRLAKHGGGCILAHCMGLGKTFQVITLIHTLFKHEITNTKHVLVVCPLSLISNWKKEFRIALKEFKNMDGINVTTLYTKQQTDNQLRILRNWHQDRGVLMMSYERFALLTGVNKLQKRPVAERALITKTLINPGPDLVVCDEAHILRNSATLRTKALNQIHTKRRIAMTGTPLQNNLMEYYHMVQFVKPNLLGTQREFKTNFVNPITNGQYGDSTSSDIRLMKNRTHCLHQLLDRIVQRYESSELEKYLPKVLDYALFVQLHDMQIGLYKNFLADVVNGEVSSRRFFSDYQCVKQICCHPRIFSILEKQKAKEKDYLMQGETVVILGNKWWKKYVTEEHMNNLQFSSKLVTLINIISEAELVGDKVLVFSQHIAEMDCIEYFLQHTGTESCPNWRPKIDYIRMDGMVHPEERSFLCERFNDERNTKLRVFIMSHRVGGLGLNLVSANRVILLGVTFNPSYDTQSVYRAYRFGQRKKVYIYRIISLGTMEETIYNRCVTKSAIASRVVDRHQVSRHYKSNELMEMYKFTFDSEKQSFAIPTDEILAKVIIKTPSIYKYHEHQSLLINRPDESLNDEEKNTAWNDYIQMQADIENQRQHAMTILNNMNLKSNYSAAVNNSSFKPNIPAQKTPLATIPSVSSNLASTSNIASNISYFDHLVNGSAKKQLTTDQVIWTETVLPNLITLPKVYKQMLPYLPSTPKKPRLSRATSELPKTPTSGVTEQNGIFVVDDDDEVIITEVNDPAPSL